MGRGEFGDSLGTLRNGMLSELSWKQKSDSGLDLSGRESLLFVISDEFGGFLGNLLIDVEDERVHDAHGSFGDSCVGMDLLKNSVDVNGEGRGSRLFVLPLWSLNFRGGFVVFGRCVSSGLSWHRRLFLCFKILII